MAFKRTYVVLSIVVMVLFSSCAAIIHGSRENIKVYSYPSGARVYVNGVSGRHAVTPGKITVKRSAVPQTLKFVRDGYEDYNYKLVPHLNYLMLLDFFPFLIPAAVDFAVGAQYTYPKIASVELKEAKKEVPQPAVTAAPSVSAGYVFNRMSDVDMDIPEGGKTFSNRYALIIGNEDYSTYQRGLTTEIDVAYARDDASAFNEYAQKVLGIPERNIILSLDATTGEMREGLAKMNLIAKNTDGKAEFVVFYAGHGLPDEETKEPYLIPVDVNGKFVNLGIPLKEFYGTLTQYPSQRVTVFIDACFSGGGRSQGLLAARGVRVTPKDELLKGNIIVFAASSGEESALPYLKEHHGLFTYYLLQKLKETKGDLMYKDLSEFMEQQVTLESIIVNSKEQHPKTNISTDVVDVWQTWNIR